MNTLQVQQSFFRANRQSLVTNCSILIYVFLFFIARYPFYQYLPVPLPIVADGSEYYRVYSEMLQGTPRFDIITPGYPFFLYVVHEFFSEQGIALYIGHSIVTFLSGLLFLFATLKYYKKCLPFASIALSLFLCQDAALRFETASFPQALMIATGLLFFAFLMGVLNKPNHFNMLMLSLSAVYLVTLKSSQMFMLPIVGVLVCYLFILNRKKIALWIFIYTTFPLLLYAGYNYRTINQFTIIASGILEADAQKQKTVTTQQQDFFYKIGSELPEWHPINWIHHSKNLDTLHSAYLTCRWGTFLEPDSDRQALNLRVLFEMNETVNVDSIVLKNSRFTSEERNWYAVNKDSLTGYIINFYPREWKRMKVYALNYFLNIKRNSPLFYYSEIEWRYVNFYVTRAWAKRYDLSNPKVAGKISFVMRELYSPERRDIAQYNVQSELMKENFFFKLYDLLNLKLIRPIARNILWVYIYLFLTAVVVVSFLLNYRNANLMFLLALSLFHLGSCLLHAIWGDPLNRYSHATEFIPYLLVAFSPLLFMRKK